MLHSYISTCDGELVESCATRQGQAVVACLCLSGGNPFPSDVNAESGASGGKYEIQSSDFDRKS